MSNQVRVRVKCASMNNIRGGQRVKREKEREWDSWEKEKSQRLAKLHKLQRKLNKGTVHWHSHVETGTHPSHSEVGVEGVTQKHVEQVKLGDSGDMIVSVIDGMKTKDGYTRLEVKCTILSI